jgi:hypothetical protein
MWITGQQHFDSHRTVTLSFTLICFDQVTADVDFSAAHKLAILTGGAGAVDIATAPFGVSYILKTQIRPCCISTVCLHLVEWLPTDGNA